MAVSDPEGQTPNSPIEPVSDAPGSDTVATLVGWVSGPLPAKPNIPCDVSKVLGYARKERPNPTYELRLTQSKNEVANVEVLYETIKS